MDIKNQSLAEAPEPDIAAIPALKAMLANLPESVRAVATQPDLFWIRQRSAIRSRIAVEQAGKQPLPWFAMAGAAALLLISGLLIRSTPSPVPQAYGDPDQELLVQIEKAVHSNVPEALAPASLLAEEINSAQPEPHPAIKENSHEN